MCFGNPGGRTQGEEKLRNPCSNTVMTEMLSVIVSPINPLNRPGPENRPYCAMLSMNATTVIPLV